MNAPCNHCKAKGYLQRDGKLVGNRQPYTVVCPACNGVGHYRVQEWRAPEAAYRTASAIAIIVAESSEVRRAAA